MIKLIKVAVPEGEDGGVSFGILMEDVVHRIYRIPDGGNIFVVRVKHSHAEFVARIDDIRYDIQERDIERETGHMAGVVQSGNIDAVREGDFTGRFLYKMKKVLCAGIAAMSSFV